MGQIEVLATVDDKCNSLNLKLRFPKVRRKIQRSFVAWLNEHKGDFKCPLQFISRKDDYLVMGIPNLHPALHIYLNQGGMGVSVYWQDFCWDLLVCFDAAPMPSAKGYYCVFFTPELRTYYASREVLWQAELFEPFLDWLNSKLFPATWLGLYRSNGCTWTELLQEPDPEAHVLLPVWLSQEEETNKDG